MYKHLLVPVDGSPLSDEAVTKAVSFARETGAKISFLNVMADYPVAYFGEGALIDPNSPERFAEMTAAHAKDVLSRSEAVALENDVTCKTIAVTNDQPYVSIIATARNENCDLIFMASHGRRGLAAVLLGSETQKVLTHATIPVLVHRSNTA